jgi:hypothetical protein
MSSPGTSKSRLAAAAAAFVVGTVISATQLFAGSLYDKTPYHTSALTGHAWVLELINGHPDRIKCKLGMRHHVFLELVTALQAVGLAATKSMTLEEQLAIFLYTSVTGLSIRHVGERFQHANATISKYVQNLKSI